ncbi:MAG: polysulfide reductase NrfD, partial [Candidatus Tectomicrobia bacterium]|nr:polysulfide reductase NrfD [Candidatus Tectomicrobia bacterium]
YQIRIGQGVTGLSHPIAWAVYIANFVFWVGIAHSGTLISAILYLLRTRWRTTVYRSAEAMTAFAIMTAGFFPIIHLGRPWYFYWLMPYPNQRGLWPNFSSPLIWDVVAVSTYLMVSLLFLYLGLIPDLATIRDRTEGLRRKAYKILSLGWRGSDEEWRHHASTYLFFASLATPLVVSVHSVVSWDFAMSIVPGWHSTIFAPYFVAGAIHSGLAMVLTLLIPLRRSFKLEEYLTIRHFENVAKVIIFTGLIVAYAYLTEFFIAWYSSSPFEYDTYKYRAMGHYAVEFWIMVIFNTLAPLSFFFKKVRTNITALLIISILINVGMWFERYVIIVTSLAHEYIPFNWADYRPTWVEISITAGSFCWFCFLFLIFIKIMPSVSMTEVKEQMVPPLRGAE